MAAATYAWSRYVERRGLETLGLTGSDRLRKFLGGLAIGIAMMGLAISAIWLAGGYRAETSFPAFASASSLFWIAFLLPCFAFQSSVEEFIFRVWLLSSVTRRWNLVAGIVATSLAFTFLHYSPHQPLRVACLSFLFSVFACAWARRANSIWGVMGWHAELHRQITDTASPRLTRVARLVRATCRDVRVRLSRPTLGAIRRILRPGLGGH